MPHLWPYVGNEMPLGSVYSPEFLYLGLLFVSLVTTILLCYHLHYAGVFSFFKHAILLHGQ